MTKPYLKLIGEDGNAFAILGRARRAAKNAGWTKEQIDEWHTKATSGDFNTLLRTTMAYFNCDGDDGEDTVGIECDVCGEEGCDGCDE